MIKALTVVLYLYIFYRNTYFKSKLKKKNNKKTPPSTPQTTNTNQPNKKNLWKG